MANIAQPAPTKPGSAAHTNISLAAIIATAPSRPQSTGFYVDMSSNAPASTVAATAAAAAPTHTQSHPGAETADRSHLFSMFIDFAEPSIHSPKKPQHDGVVTLRRRRRPETVSPASSTTTGNSSSRQSWTMPANGNGGHAADACFTFDTTNAAATAAAPPPNGRAAAAAVDDPEDSCSGSVISADHGYQSMPMQLAAKGSRSSRCSAQSLASTASVGSSREDVCRKAPRSRPTNNDNNDNHNQHSNDDTNDDAFSKDSVESLCQRESSFSDAEEAAGVRVARGRSSCHSSYGDLAATAASAAVAEPAAGHRSSHKLPMLAAGAHQLRKNNSLSHVGEQLMRAQKQQQQQQQMYQQQYSSEHTMESLQATIERQQKLLLLETVNEETPLSSFVKLSDMDRQPEKIDGWPSAAGSEQSQKMSRSSGSNGKAAAERTPGGGRSSMSRSMGTNLSNLASCEDTLRSLSRLFPHLSQELALSPTADSAATYAAAPLPPDRNNLTTHTRTGSVDHSDYNMLSDLSAVSSCTSSCSRSGGLDSADEWSLAGRQPRRLGEDLLKMFLQEIATDVTLDVAGRPIRAHKCILRSRCQYFAAMLAGAGASSAAEVRLQLGGYSFGSVHFALCHIYSGAAHPPQGISLFELAALADMLALEGLKEVTTHALRAHYCHNFHKPCSGCIEGIMRVFPVTLQHGLDELYTKCLRWTCKHYVTVWSTRAFALLPADLIERCVQYVVAHVNSETVLTLLLNCDNIVTMLSSCRWAIGVENTVRDLIDTARAYVADHFANLLASDCFLSLGQDQSANIARLENLLLRTASTLTPEQACRSYQRVTRLNGALRAKLKGPPAANSTDSSSSSSPEDEAAWNGEFLRFVEAILLAIEHCLTRQCARAMRTQQWQRMELELRKRIQGLACLTDSMESKRSSKHNYPQETTGWTNHHQVPDMHEVKLAIESLSKRSKEGRYPAQSAAPQRGFVKADPNLDKVTKLRKPTAVVPALLSAAAAATTVARPQSIHVSRPSNHLEPAARNPRLFKHSISMDAAPIAHRPPQPRSSSTSTATAGAHLPTKSASSAARFAEIRPRYLEPKSRLATQSVDNLTLRNSQPALNQLPKRSSTKSINSLGLSRDSLATNTTGSRTNAAAAHRPKPYRSQTIMSQDSLNSRRSVAAAPPNRSMSRDSLAKSNSMTRLRRPFGSVPPAAGAASSSASEDLPSPGGTGTGTTTTTTRSSRLSSGGYLGCSPRDSNASAVRRSTGTTATVVPPPRKSFLSAKSREILAKRSAALQRTESLRGVEGAQQAQSQLASASSATGLNKSSSTSNIPTGARRPLAAHVQTTLHMRRAARGLAATANVGASPPPPQQQQQRQTATVAPRLLTTTTATKKAAQTASNQQIKHDLEQQRRAEKSAVTAASNKESPDRDERWVEPRMERSQTFCKDSPDLDASTLTIVE